MFSEENTIGGNIATVLILVLIIGFVLLILHAIYNDKDDSNTYNETMINSSITNVTPNENINNYIKQQNQSNIMEVANLTNQTIETFVEHMDPTNINTNLETNDANSIQQTSLVDYQHLIQKIHENKSIMSTLQNKKDYMTGYVKTLSARKARINKKLVNETELSKLATSHAETNAFNDKIKWLKDELAEITMEDQGLHGKLTQMDKLISTYETDIAEMEKEIANIPEAQSQYNDYKEMITTDKLQNQQNLLEPQASTDQIMNDEKEQPIITQPTTDDLKPPPFASDKLNSDSINTMPSLETTEPIIEPYTAGLEEKLLIKQNQYHEYDSTHFIQKTHNIDDTVLVNSRYMKFTLGKIMTLNLPIIMGKGDLTIDFFLKSVNPNGLEKNQEFMRLYNNKQYGQFDYHAINLIPSDYNGEYSTGNYLQPKRINEWYNYIVVCRKQEGNKAEGEIYNYQITTYINKGNSFEKLRTSTYTRVNGIQTIELINEPVNGYNNEYWVKDCHVFDSNVYNL
jgi:predicted  nucleic acid-binding Zn-ribbon protein